MTCVHLQQLFQLCEESEIKLGAGDLVRFVCNQCGEQEVCPSVLMDEYNARSQQDDTADAEQPPAQ